MELIAVSFTYTLCRNGRGYTWSLNNGGGEEENGVRSWTAPFYGVLGGDRYGYVEGECEYAVFQQVGLLSAQCYNLAGNGKRGRGGRFGFSGGLPNRSRRMIAP